MGRPRSFDDEEVLGRALDVFWSRGYAATSIADLEEAMGIKAGSIYKAFTDKRTLFMRAVELYLRHGQQMTLDAVENLAPREALKSWLYTVAEMATEKPPRGCFAVNCAVELAPHDEAVRRSLRAHDRQMTLLFAELVRRGQRAGELRKGDAALQARHLRLFISGLQVEGKKGLSRAEAKRLVDQFLETLAA